MVGVTGFEPATPTSRTYRSSQLGRYEPKLPIAQLDRVLGYEPGGRELDAEAKRRTSGAAASNLSGRTNINDLDAMFFRAVLLRLLCYSFVYTSSFEPCWVRAISSK